MVIVPKTNAEAREGLNNKIPKPGDSMLIPSNHIVLKNMSKPLWQGKRLVITFMSKDKPVSQVRATPGQEQDVIGPEGTVAMEHAEDDVLHFLDSATGDVQGSVEVGARIFSRPHTKKLMKLVESAKSSKDHEKLAKEFMKMINKQDTQEQQYVNR